MSCDFRSLSGLTDGWADPPIVPVYQRIGAQAAEMRRAGAAFHAIAEHFGVDDHTAGKAVIRPPVP